MSGLGTRLAALERRVGASLAQAEAAAAEPPPVVYVVPDAPNPGPGHTRHGEPVMVVRCRDDAPLGTWLVVNDCQDPRVSDG